MTEIKLYGIRHHGPGSARSLLRVLAIYQPDVVLIEGPPDAADVLHLLIDKAMKPPIALTIYAVNTPSLSAYFPFAVFSPEYQTIRFAQQQQTPVVLMDLPQRYMLSLRQHEHNDMPQPLDPLAD